MNKEEFKNKVEELGIIITDEMLTKLNKYYELLITWNKKFNLTRITEEKEVYLKHFYDSLSIKRAINLYNYNNLVDVGTGAGFPGIVLAIIFKNLKIDLIEANSKKCSFLTVVKETLSLDNIQIINERAESYAKIAREKYEIATCRAVSHLNIISEIIIPMIKVSGYFLPLKGEIDKEIKEGLSILTKLNAKLVEVKTFKLPIENSNRSILIIKKINTTNIIYPREYNKIIKDLKNRQK